MKNSKKAWIVFRRILLVLFVFFLISYFQAENGNNYLKDKTILTEENIKRFEDDVKNGTYIDIKDYVEYSNIDTSNIVSDTGYIVSEKVSKIVGKDLVNILKTIGKLFS